MSNTIVSNYQPLSTTHVFSVIWKLTRILKNAGWIYKSSGNGTSKDTSATAANDLWGGQSNPLTDTYSLMSVLSTGAQTLPTATLNTATSPITAGFATSGTLQVATSTNGWQTVTYTGTTAGSFTGCSGGVGTVPTGSEIGGGAISMDQATGWWNAQGPSTLKIPLAVAQAPGVNGPFIRGENLTQAVTQAQGELLGYLFDAAAQNTTIAAGSNGSSLPQATISVASTTGFNTSGTILVTTSAGVQTVTYTGTTGISFTGCSGGTGTMSTGGAISQGQGYLVVQPRVDGYGADPHGWDHSHVITGALSGSQVTPNTTIIEFFREVVFWKQNTITSGSIYYQCLDGYAESAFRFSNLSTTANANVTGVTAPGGTTSIATTIAAGSNGASLPQATINVVSTTTFVAATAAAPATITVVTSNGPQTVTYTGTSGGTQFTGCSGGTGTMSTGGAVSQVGFPTNGTFVIEGTGGSQAPVNWLLSGSVGNNFGRAAFIGVNATYATGLSADGSFTVALGSPFVNSGSFLGIMFTRVDNQEDGDVDPYTWYCPSSDTLYTPTRTVQTTTPSSNANDAWQPQALAVASNFFRFWRRRGWGGANDMFQNGTFGLMTGAASSTIVISQNNFDREKLANTYNDTYVLEDVWCISYQNVSSGATPTGKQRKGSCRWLKAVEGGAGTDMYGGKIWLQLANAGTTQQYALVVGPWDGTSVQTQA